MPYICSIDGIIELPEIQNRTHEIIHIDNTLSVVTPIKGLETKLETSTYDSIQVYSGGQYFS